MKLADNENADGCLFVQAGQPVNAVFGGTNILGHENSHEWTIISSVAAKTQYVIQCDPDIPVFSFKWNEGFTFLWRFIQCPSLFDFKLEGNIGQCNR